jgi:hypothetical protein
MSEQFPTNPMTPTCSQLTAEQIRLNMLGLTSDSESVDFESQLVSTPEIADLAKEVAPDAFVAKVKRFYDELRGRTRGSRRKGKYENRKGW